MFPVLDVNGRPVAFGARSLDPEDQPKYLNSPETPAYTKGEHLYGLFQAKDEIRKKKFAILVEGYLDLIALDQFGITNVAASLGTAFTPEQSKLLAAFHKKVVINYDGDPAGIKAARRAIEHCCRRNSTSRSWCCPTARTRTISSARTAWTHITNARGKASRFLSFALEASVADAKSAQRQTKGRGDRRISARHLSDPQQHSATREL